MKNKLLETKLLLDEADAILVGIGSGMTNADGISYYGPRFEKHFQDFINKYKFIDMLQASVFEFSDWLTYWAFHSRFVKMNYYDQETSKSFYNLKDILKNKNFFIITTNSDSALHKAKFDKDKYFYIQGQYNLMQCSSKCVQKTWEDKNLIEKMIKEQENLKIPEYLLPKCPLCKSPLEVYKRNCFQGLVEDENYKREKNNYQKFLENNKNKKIIYFEIGCGNITPQYIKWKFWELTEENPKATYLVVNQKQYRTKKEILNQSHFIYEDIGEFLNELAKMYKNN